MAANMAAKTQKYVYIRSEVSYNYKWSVEYNIFKVKESMYRSGNSVRMLLSKMASNMEVTSAELRMLNLIAPKTCELDPVPSLEAGWAGFKWLSKLPPDCKCDISF